ncbi:486_t:CDS:2 [Rhizophagus irregularis]|nr:486_t:CDS:2 [Rhizophagus irregularis]
MGRKRMISSVFDENPITTRSPQVTTRLIVQPRIRKVPCFCSNCEGMLVASRTKNRHELSSQLSLENTEIRDIEPSEVLENTENINDESSQLTILMSKELTDCLEDVD